MLLTSIRSSLRFDKLFELLVLVFFELDGDLFKLERRIIVLDKVFNSVVFLLLFLGGFDGDPGFIIPIKSHNFRLLLA